MPCRLHFVLAVVASNYHVEVALRVISELLDVLNATSGRDL